MSNYYPGVLTHQVLTEFEVQYIRTCVRIHISTHVRMCVPHIFMYYISLSTYVRTYISTYTPTYSTCVYVALYCYVCTCAHMYVCTYVRMYLYTYIFIYLCNTYVYE